MKLFNTLQLMVRAVAPTTGVTAGAMYYDSIESEPRYHDGQDWNSFATIGFPLIATDLHVPHGRQLMYFDTFRNDGVLSIDGNGYLVGIR